MSLNQTSVANTLRRSRTLSLLLVLLFTLSTMSLPACSDSDNNTVAQRVVHATVYFDDEDPAATAWVQDGDQNFVSDAILSINGRPFEVITLGDEESDEDSVPIYYLELHDLKGGDSLTFVAKRSDGTLIYAPPAAQIPMPIELVEPEPDQAIIPGEEVVVSWTGGEGGSHIAAFYADDLGEEQYLDVQKYGEAEAITIPAGIIMEGGGIIGAASLSGDSASFQVNVGADQLDSSFVVFRQAADLIPDQTVLEGNSGGCPPGQRKGSSGRCCPDSGDSFATSTSLCMLEMVAIFGHALWGARYGIDAGKFPKCSGYVPGHVGYCMYYSLCFSHYKWMAGCNCPSAGNGCPPR